MAPDANTPAPETTLPVPVDEWDEAIYGIPTRTYLWDVTDLDPFAPGIVMDRQDTPVHGRPVVLQSGRHGQDPCLEIHRWTRRQFTQQRPGLRSLLPRSAIP